jgi:hypothetical protein
MLPQQKEGITMFARRPAASSAAEMIGCPHCHATSISIEENARALFKEIECPVCAEHLRVNGADAIRALGIVLVLTLGLLGFYYRDALRPLAPGIFVSLAVFGLLLIPKLRRLPLKSLS